MYPNFPGAKNQDLAAPLIFSGALGLVFVYIDSSPFGLLRMHNHDFPFGFLHSTHISM